jgi:hypothetical protein
MLLGILLIVFYVLIPISFDVFRGLNYEHIALGSFCVFTVVILWLRAVEQDVFSGICMGALSLLSIAAIENPTSEHLAVLQMLEHEATVNSMFAASVILSLITIWRNFTDEKVTVRDI